jgi:hypothetical protein
MATGDLKNNQPKSKKGGARPGAGRPKGAVTKATADIRALASQYGPAALKELARLAEHAESEAARVSAIKELLDRGYGRSPQPITGHEGGAIVHEIHIVGVEP